MTVHHIPGEFIDLAHVLSHIGDLMRKRSIDLQSASLALPVTIQALPSTLHTYHPDQELKKLKSSDPQDSHVVQHLDFTREDIQEMARAYTQDESEFHKIPLSHIYIHDHGVTTKRTHTNPTPSQGTDIIRVDRHPVFRGNPAGIASETLIHSIIMSKSSLGRLQ